MPDNRQGRRSLPLEEWPAVDREAWIAACRPRQRLKGGGRGGHLAAASRALLQHGYAALLGFLQRQNRLRPVRRPAELVTSVNVKRYVDDKKRRVGSVTIHTDIRALCTLVRLIAPNRNWRWLIELEQDLKAMAVPRSKAGRVVFTERLVKAGLTLILEAEKNGKTLIAKAVGVRDGLMIALLALMPIRRKNFAALIIGKTLLKINGRWWIRIPAAQTKSRRVDQRPVPELLTEVLNRYIDVHRPALLRGKIDDGALWLAPQTGRGMLIDSVGYRIALITQRTLGVKVSAHLFRTAAASTVAVYVKDNPYLGTALLAQADPRITIEHYNRAMDLTANAEYAGIVDKYLLEPATKN